MGIVPDLKLTKRQYLWVEGVSAVSYVVAAISTFVLILHKAQRMDDMPEQKLEEEAEIN